MKKIVIILIAIIGYTINLNAQSCVISGAEDGSTVEVQSCYISGDNVTVNVINDSKDIAANVTVIVDVTYRNKNGTKTSSYSGKAISLARVTTKIEIPISKELAGGFVVYSVEAKSVSGTKCK